MSLSRNPVSWIWRDLTSGWRKRLLAAARGAQKRPAKIATTHESRALYEVEAQLDDNIILTAQYLRYLAGNPSRYSYTLADGGRSRPACSDSTDTHFFMTCRLTFCMSTFWLNSGGNLVLLRSLASTPVAMRGNDLAGGTLRSGAVGGGGVEKSFGRRGGFREGGRSESVVTSRLLGR